MEAKDLANVIKTELPYINLNENEIQEAFVGNDLVFVPSTYRATDGTFFTKEQDQVLNFVYSHDVKGISILGKEDDYQVLALKDDVIDLGIIILTSPVAQQILFGVLGNVFYDILKSSVRYVFKFRTNATLNKVGELKYQDANGKLELREVELTNEAMFEIINKFANGSRKNKTHKRSKQSIKSNKQP